MKNSINYPFCFLLLYFFAFISQELKNTFYFQNVSGDHYYGEYKTHKYYVYLDEIGKEIMKRVDESKEIIFLPKENTPFCKSNPGYAGYVDWPKRNGTDFGICSFRVIEGQDYETAAFNINSVVRHEGMHAAQFCKRPGFDNPGLYPLKITSISNLLKYEMNLESDIYDGIPENQKIAELEANYVEDKPYLISELIEAHCY